MDKVQVYYENGMLCSDDIFKTTDVHLYRCLRCKKYLSAKNNFALLTHVR